MTRPYRFTVRLTATELSTINKYANQIHAIPSVAVRILLAKALAEGNERAYIKKIEQRTSAGSP
ncbi:MAG: hypothetical protein WCD69_06995 [Xanthobacteraceae bacterium]